MTQSCEYDKTNNLKELWECNARQNLDSAKLTNELIGTWIWTYHYDEIGGTIIANKDVKVTFSTGTFKVFENSVIITQGSWSIRNATSIELYLEMSNPSDYLGGRILLCGNQVMFNGSYVDGPDNLFTRE